MIWVQSDRFLYENKEYCKNDCLLCYSKTLCVVNGDKVGQHYAINLIPVTHSNASKISS